MACCILPFTFQALTNWRYLSPFQLLAKEPITAEPCWKKEFYSPVKLYSPHGRRIANELSKSASSLSRDKATWTPAFHEIFVDRCLEETLEGNRPGTHITKESWRSIVESFNEKASVNYSRVQIKNHWDATKEQWRIWCKLVTTSSMKWDHVNSKFGASEEDWMNYIQVSKAQQRQQRRQSTITTLLNQGQQLQFRKSHVILQSMHDKLSYSLGNVLSWWNGGGRTRM